MITTRVKPNDYPTVVLNNFFRVILNEVKNLVVDPSLPLRMTRTIGVTSMPLGGAFQDEII